MTFWKDQPLAPVPPNLRTQWDGTDFVIIYEPTETVILRVSGASGNVSANLPNSSVTPSKLTGLGASTTYAKTSAGEYSHIVASTSAKTVIVTLEVTEAFVDNAGTQPTFTIGDATTADGILAVTELAAAALGTRITVGGTITAGEPLVVTAVAATGNGTGAVKITAIAVQ